MSNAQQRILLPIHVQHLRTSGLSDATITAAQIYSITDPTEAGRILNWSGPASAPAIAFPVFAPDGSVVTTILRPDSPNAREDGGAPKYETPVGVAPRCYFPPAQLVDPSRWADPSQELIFTEGIKKILAAVQAGAVGVSAQGTTVWHDIEQKKKTNEWRLHADFRALPLKDRDVIIAFDGGDTSSNPNVVLAEARLANMLDRVGARVRLMRIPAPDGVKVGLDDFLAKQPDPIAALKQLMASAIPADPLLRIHEAAAQPDPGAAVLALLADPSFAAALHVAPKAVTDLGAVQLRQIAGITKASMHEAVDRFESSRRHKKTTDGNTSADVEGNRYEVVDGRLCWAKPQRGGGETMVPLAHFDAQIVEEVTFDDGAETHKSLRVHGTLNEQPLPECVVPASEFGSMSWVMREWGARAVVCAGPSVPDHLREAIQTQSKPSSRHVFSHTGWRKTEDGWAYLHSGGAVGAQDLEVKLDDALSRFSLPEKAEDVVAAVRLSASLLDAGPDSVTVPLLAAVYVAPLCSILRPDFAICLVGSTGNLKSELAALAQSHYGDFSRMTLPGSWSSTDNALEGQLFILKDALCVVDDYAPQPGKYAAQDLQRRAARIIRSVGNGASRGRLRADLTQRPERPPRGLMISTGEDLPPGSSIRARLYAVEVERNGLNLPLITELQSQRGRLRHAMRAYLEWLRPRLDDFGTSLPRLRERMRPLFQGATGHARHPDTLAHLLLGVYVLSQFAVDVGAMSKPDGRRLVRRALNVLRAGANEQAEVAADVDVARAFVGVLSDLLAQKKVVLLDKHQPLSAAGLGEEAIGWRDSEFAYVVPGLAKRRVAAFMRDSGEQLALSDRALHRELVRAGAVTPAKSAGRTTATSQMRLGGNRQWVLRMPPHVLGLTPTSTDADDPPDEDTSADASADTFADSQSVDSPSEMGRVSALSALSAQNRTYIVPTVRRGINAQSIHSQPPPPPSPSISADSADRADTRGVSVGEHRVEVSALSPPRSADRCTGSADTGTIDREPGFDDVGAGDELPVDTTLEDAPF
ncbi:MAG: DUF3854 domain-containing protein [Polyangia bacterium]